MNNSITRALVAAAIIVTPASFAFAKQGEHIPVPVLGGATVNTAIEAQAEIHGGTGRDHTEDNSVQVGATSTHKGGYWSNSDNAEDIRGSEQTGDLHGSTTATTSRDQKGNDRDQDNHGSRGSRVPGGLGAFFSWFMGLPASTTVGDVRVQLTASSSATAGHGEDLGIFARILSFFHFGGRDY